jgi:hypothetical protein
MATRQSLWDRLARLREVKESLLEASVYIFVPGPKGSMPNAVRTAVILARDALKESSKRTKLLPRMKRP